MSFALILLLIVAAVGTVGLGVGGARQGQEEQEGAAHGDSDARGSADSARPLVSAARRP